MPSELNGADGEHGLLTSSVLEGGTNPHLSIWNVIIFDVLSCKFQGFYLFFLTITVLSLLGNEMFLPNVKYTYSDVKLS